MAKALPARTDVAIIGGGPAGAAAALALSQHHQRRVVIIDRGKKGPILGETLSPGAVPFLEYLNLDQQFRRAGHRPALEMSSAWGSSRLA